MFEHQTFIVLDIPSPMTEKIQKIRDRFDHIVATTPVEITITGSSGVGVFERDQDQESLFAYVEAVAKDFPSFYTSFLNVGRFPNTDIFYLQPDYPEKFEALQARIKEKKIAFKPSPFPFSPHCTLRSTVPLTEEDEKELLSLKAPSERFLIETLSVYEVTTAIKCNLLYRTKLK